MNIRKFIEKNPHVVATVVLILVGLFFMSRTDTLCGAREGLDTKHRRTLPGYGARIAGNMRKAGAKLQDRLQSVFGGQEKFSMEDAKRRIRATRKRMGM